MSVDNPFYNYRMARLCRIRTGGEAFCYLEAYSVESLLQIIKWINEQNLNYFVIGAGSNILVSDDGFNGVVIRLKGDFQSIRYDHEDSTVSVGAGAPLMQLGFDLARRGYRGFSYMAVIPGFVGGAVTMNAGTSQSGEIKDHLLNALVLDPQSCEVIRYKKSEMMFGYRESAISSSRLIVLEACFELKTNRQGQYETNAALEEVRSLLAKRRSMHPRNPRTFGSTFKKPGGGKPAGWYLDQVGMKGVREGGAMVSEEHANWILNIGEAKTSDVKHLMNVGQKRVFEEFGIQLEREVILVPEDVEKML